MYVKYYNNIMSLLISLLQLKLDKHQTKTNNNNTGNGRRASAPFAPSPLYTNAHSIIDCCSYNNYLFFKLKILT